jgi:sirohydrochlorin ferrochelatase
VLVLCSHGTRSAAGRAAVRGIVSAVAARVEVPVREAYVDVHGPSLDEVLQPGAVVVPLLLSAGYHVRVDIASAARAVGDVTVAPPLGAPDPAPPRPLVELLHERLTEAGLAADDAVVLAAAGSSDDAAAVSVEAMGAALAAGLGRVVHVAYGAARAPTVPDQVASLRARGAARVVVAAYLLAPGHFHDRLLEAGADAVARPLVTGAVPDPRLVAVVLDRHRRASALRACMEPA